ncbi:MAG: DUF3570 domain-containing protein [Flavobacteriaceae bacterium]|nr:DUF3570 domain-containing protein [Flavobacteriaceae bacterium]
MKKLMLSIAILSFSLQLFAQEKEQQKDDDFDATYKKRALDQIEVEHLISYYRQTGDNASVTGGIGTEKLTDVTPTFVVAIPLNDDDVLTIDAGISAYTSASSSNIDPFDGDGPANAFQSSTGASESDIWVHFSPTYTHNSEDRNTIWSANASFSIEYDYTSLGAGGSYTRLFNEKNTSLTFTGTFYYDIWNTIFPVELRPFEEGGDGLNNSFFQNRVITGNPNYNPNFSTPEDDTKITMAFGTAFSQIINKNSQFLLSLDIIRQNGLLSNPFQRVYFGDTEASFIEEFQLADDIERLPDTRLKIALGGRYNYYLNSFVSLRFYYRYYTDDWDITSHTASLEVPLKISNRFTLIPNYRYYTQTESENFAPFEGHLSTQEYYTSDFDLSDFNANQYGLSVRYVDPFNKFHISRFGLKSFEIGYKYYDRNISLNAHFIGASFKFVHD